MLREANARDVHPSDRLPPDADASEDSDDSSDGWSDSSGSEPGLGVGNSIGAGGAHGTPGSVGSRSAGLVSPLGAAMPMPSLGVGLALSSGLAARPWDPLPAAAAAAAAAIAKEEAEDSTHGYPEARTGDHGDTMPEYKLDTAGDKPHKTQLTPTQSYRRTGDAAHGLARLSAAQRRSAPDLSRMARQTDLDPIAAALDGGDGSFSVTLPFEAASLSSSSVLPLNPRLSFRRGSVPLPVPLPPRPDGKSPVLSARASPSLNPLPIPDGEADGDSDGSRRKEVRDARASRKQRR